jgi:phenylacetate-CoA ligase
MPLIRYKLGDIGTFTHEECDCGRGFPLIKSIEGRTDDFLILPSGRKISPRVINVIEDIPGVSRYKTIQETKNRIVVNLVKGEGFSEKTIYEINKHIKAGCLGEDVEVDVKLVKELPLEKRGKLRAVVSNVKE